MNDAGVNNLYAISNTTDEVKKALSNDFRMIENWFHENVMVLNAKKKKRYYYVHFGNRRQDVFIFNGIKLPNSCEG